MQSFGCASVMKNYGSFHLFYSRPMITVKASFILCYLLRLSFITQPCACLCQNVILIIIIGHKNDPSEGAVRWRRHRGNTT